MKRLWFLPLCLLFFGFTIQDMQRAVLMKTAGVTPATVLDDFVATLGDNCDPCTATFTVSSGATQLVVIQHWEDASATSDSASWSLGGGESLSATGCLPTPQTGNNTKAWYLDNPTPGSGTISIDMSTGADDSVIIVATLQDAATGGPRTPDNYSAASDNENTFTISGVQSTDVVIVTASVNGSTLGDAVWTWGAGLGEESDNQFGASTPSASAGSASGDGSSTLTATANRTDRWIGCALAWAAS